MASANSEAVRTLAKEIVGAMKTLTDNNNRNYVNNEIKNYRMTSSNIGTSLYADFARIAAAQIGVAVIDTAQIRDLEATTINTINLAAEKAKIGDLSVESLSSAIAQLGLTNIGTANIGYGQIKDLVAGTAIIREGEQGKLYVDRLAVTDANVVSLTTGELMLKDANGNFVRIIVDPDTGEISSEPVTFSGDQILIDNSMAGTKIIESSITARELNVSSIFADQALIRAIKAANIDVANLFASQAFAGTLYTNVIENPSVIIGDDGSHNVGTAIWSDTAPSDQEDGDTWVDTSVNPNVFKEYQTDHWVTIGALSSLKSAINLFDRGIKLVVQGEDSSSELILTDKMLRAIANKVNLMADDIDLSGNNTVTISSANQISVTAANNLDLSANTTTVTADKVNAIADDIDLSSNHTMTFNADQLSAIAEDIDLESNHTMTFNATQLNQIARDITIGADRVDVSGKDINFAAANSLEFSAQQLKALGDNIDITANDAITLIAKSSAHVFRGTEYPVTGVNPGDLFVKTDTGELYQSESVVDFGGFYYDDETGVLYHDAPEEYDYSIILNEDGFIAADGIAFSIDENGNVSETTGWVLVRDQYLSDAIAEDVVLKDDLNWRKWESIQTAVQIEPDGLHIYPMTPDNGVDNTGFSTAITNSSYKVINAKGTTTQTRYPFVASGANNGMQMIGAAVIYSDDDGDLIFAPRSIVNEGSD